VTTLCEGGYAMPARPDNGEFVWKVFERPVAESSTEDTPAVASPQAPSRRKVLGEAII